MAVLALSSSWSVVRQTRGELRALPVAG